MKRKLTGIGLALILLSDVAHAQSARDAVKLIGSWKLVKGVYGGKPLNSNGQIQIKNVTDTQFMWFWYKEGSSTVTDVGGGRYSVKGDIYSERLDYGLGNSFTAVKGHVISLKWKVDGNNWHISGKLSNGLPIEEDWQKLLPQEVVP